MIEVVELSRGYPRGSDARPRAIEAVTLAVAPGRVTGLLGPNGAGKTTLFRVLCGLLRPDGGSASVAGCDVATRPLEARARLGLLTEEPGLPARLTPVWHVALHASLRGFHREEALRCAAALLREMGLSSCMGRPHARLSRGARAKVALARALVHRPPALLLDEPTAHLDIETADWMRRAIREKARDGCAVLIATHNPAEAEQLCDEVVVLGRGRVLATGAIDEVRAKDGGGPRLVVRLSGPAAAALPTVRDLRGAALAMAESDRLSLEATAADAAALVAALPAAVAPLSIVEFRHETGSLEKAYHRIQRSAS